MSRALPLVTMPAVLAACGAAPAGAANALPTGKATLFTVNHAKRKPGVGAQVCVHIVPRKAETK